VESVAECLYEIPEINSRMNRDRVKITFSKSEYMKGDILFIEPVLTL